YPGIGARSSPTPPRGPCRIPRPGGGGGEYNNTVVSLTGCWTGKPRGADREVECTGPQAPRASGGERGGVGAGRDGGRGGAVDDAGEGAAGARGGGVDDGPRGGGDRLRRADAPGRVRGDAGHRSLRDRPPADGARDGDGAPGRLSVCAVWAHGV